MSEFDAKNREAYIDSTDYQNIAQEQKGNILAFFHKYSYRRTFGTLFSDGSMTGLGDRFIYIYVYEDATLVDYIIVSSMGNVVIAQKTYEMENADYFINQVIEILDEQ